VALSLKDQQRWLEKFRRNLGGASGLVTEQEICLGHVWTSTPRPILSPYPGSAVGVAS
jgi:hypothetical protein